MYYNTRMILRFLLLFYFFVYSVAFLHKPALSHVPRQLTMDYTWMDTTIHIYYTKEPFFSRINLLSNNDNTIYSGSYDLQLGLEKYTKDKVVLKTESILIYDENTFLDIMYSIRFSEMVEFTLNIDSCSWEDISMIFFVKHHYQERLAPPM